MVFKKIIFQNMYVALETPPFMANAILNFHFDYWHTSLSPISIYIQLMRLAQLELESLLQLIVHLPCNVATKHPRDLRGTET